MATIPPITKAVPPTRTYKERPTPGETYAQITSKNLSPAPTPAPAPPANLPLQQFNDISDLKTLMKSLFEQMGTMINLLTTALTKLK
jgi:hypothetical protein